MNIKTSHLWFKVRKGLLVGFIGSLLGSLVYTLLFLILFGINAQWFLALYILGVISSLIPANVGGIVLVNCFYARRKNLSLTPQKDWWIGSLIGVLSGGVICLAYLLFFLYRSGTMRLWIDYAIIAEIVASLIGGLIGWRLAIILNKD